MRVLMVDDDQDLVTVYTTTFSQAGFSTSYSYTGEEGLQKARLEKPDIILLDQVLPDISGNDILKTLKSTEDTKDIPVILLSNFSQGEIVKNALEEGAIEYLFKYQIEPKEVVAKVKEILKMP